MTRAEPHFPPDHGAGSRDEPARARNEDGSCMPVRNETGMEQRGPRERVCAPDPSPGHDDGLPAGVLLVIDTRLDLEPYRIERGGSAREHGYAYTHHELKAAFEHPRVTRERVAEGIEPPERGRRLALYDAIARWIGHVERGMARP